MTREEIIRNLKYTMEKHKNDTVNAFGTNISVMCKDILDYLEQEPKTGEWIIKDNMFWVCSECGCQTRMMKKYNTPNYCPACGVRMIESQKGANK